MLSAISIRNLSKKYSASISGKITNAVQDISIEIAVGEAFGFIGPNGAGKSTTIKILMGLVYPSSGETCFFGCPTTDPRARSGVGYVPENAFLPDYLTPHEILMMSLVVHGISRDKVRFQCEMWLARLGLKDVMHVQ